MFATFVEPKNKCTMMLFLTQRSIKLVFKNKSLYDRPFAIHLVSSKPGSAKLCRRVEHYPEQVVGYMFGIGFRTVPVTREQILRLLH